MPPFCELHQCHHSRLSWAGPFGCPHCEPNPSPAASPIAPPLEREASVRLTWRGLLSLTNSFGRLLHKKRGGVMLTREMATAIYIELSDKLDAAALVAPRVETEGDAALTQEELQALRFPLAPGHPTKQLAALAKLGWIEEPGNFHDGQRTVFYGPHPCERCGHLIVRVAQDHGGQEFDQPDGPIYPNTTWRWHDCPNRDTPAPHPVRPHTPGSRPPVDPKEGT